MGNLKIGIPQALLYYEYFPLWKGFLESLDAEVIITGPTTKEIVDLGIRSAISEICFPVKIFYGHVMSLKDRVDYLFIPRMVCVEKGAYFCPKFLGLPDMIKSSLSSIPPLIEPTIDIRKSATNIKNSFLAVGKLITNNSKKIYQSFYEAQKSLRSYFQSNENELTKKIISQQYNNKFPQNDFKEFRL